MFIILKLKTIINMLLKNYLHHCLFDNKFPIYQSENKPTNQQASALLIIYQFFQVGKCVFGESANTEHHLDLNQLNASSCKDFFYNSTNLAEFLEKFMHDILIGLVLIDPELKIADTNDLFLDAAINQCVEHLGVIVAMVCDTYQNENQYTREQVKDIINNYIGHYKQQFKLRLLKRLADHRGKILEKLTMACFFYTLIYSPSYKKFVGQYFNLSFFEKETVDVLNSYSHRLALAALGQHLISNHQPAFMNLRKAQASTVVAITEEIYNCYTKFTTINVEKSWQCSFGIGVAVASNFISAGLSSVAMLSVGAYLGFNSFTRFLTPTFHKKLFLNYFNLAEIYPEQFPTPSVAPTPRKEMLWQNYQRVSTAKKQKIDHTIISNFMKYYLNNSPKKKMISRPKKTIDFSVKKPNPDFLCQEKEPSKIPVAFMDGFTEENSDNIQPIIRQRAKKKTTAPQPATETNIRSNAGDQSCFTDAEQILLLVKQDKRRLGFYITRAQLSQAEQQDHTFSAQKFIDEEYSRIVPKFGVFGGFKYLKSYLGISMFEFKMSKGSKYRLVFQAAEKSLHNECQRLVSSDITLPPIYRYVRIVSK